MAKGKVSFNKDRCKGCGLCIEACPLKIVKLDNGGINKKGYNPVHVLEMDKCIACTNCAMMCPDEVITVEKF